MFFKVAAGYFDPLESHSRSMTFEKWVLSFKNSLNFIEATMAVTLFSYKHSCC